MSSAGWEKLAVNSVACRVWRIPPERRDCCICPTNIELSDEDQDIIYLLTMSG